MSVKTFTLLQNISVLKKCCSFFIKRSYRKSINASTNIVNINNLTIFNIDDDAKCFLSSKSACYNDFEGPYDAEIGVMAAENSALLALTNTLFVTYTIIQSIMRSEMCSLRLTHPSAHTHTWSSGQPTLQRPGSSHGLPAGAGIRTHNLGLPRVSSPTLYPLGHDCPLHLKEFQ